MQEPTAGAVIFAKSLEPVATFYSRVLLAPAHIATGHAVVECAGIRLTVNAIPEWIANEIHIETPPVRREEASIKLSFPVPSLQGARLRASEHGGTIDEKSWEFNGRRYADGHDPEGNVVQFHERLDQA